MALLETLASFSAAGAALQAGILADNWRWLRRLPVAGGEAGLVSVLVPARNEEATIGRLVASVLAEREAKLELWVLDDHSEDGTADAAIAAASCDSRLNVVAGAALPLGWAGKNHACNQLAGLARGEWLLFVDADTVLEPGFIPRAVALAKERGAGLLSVFPQQEMRTAGEGLMLPLLMVILTHWLPLRLAERLGDPRLAAANGQCLLFTRRAYAACGGHAAVAGDWVEDMALARAVKASGERLVVADGVGGIRCRMYTGLAPLWQGFRKNLYPAFGGQPGPFWGTIALWTAWQVAPWALLALGLALGRPWVWGPAGVAAGLAVAGRLALALRLRQPLWSVWLHPLAAGLLLVLALDSWRGRFTGVSWKGRVYGQRA